MPFPALLGDAVLASLSFGSDEELSSEPATITLIRSGAAVTFDSIRSSTSVLIGNRRSGPAVAIREGE